MLIKSCIYLITKMVIRAVEYIIGLILLVSSIIGLKLQWFNCWKL